MRQLTEATSKITHDTVALTTKAVRLVKRYGKRNDDGSIVMHMTHKSFGIAFENVADLVEAVGICEEAFDRLSFAVSRYHVTVVYA